jgi:hypothetical protein
MANCNLRPTSSVLSVLIASRDARCGHSFPSFDRRLDPTGKAGRPAFGSCRVSAGPASTANPQSWPKACAQPARRGSYHRWFVYSFHAPGTRSPFAVVLKPSTLLHLHSLLCRRKYRLLFSPKRGRRPGPKGPKREIIDAVIEMKRRNPNWGCPRLAQQIALAFGVEIDKDVVRRILSIHYRPESDAGGPSWLTFLGHTKDSLWSCDLFRCESATLRTHWILVVVDQFTSRI